MKVYYRDSLSSVKESQIYGSDIANCYQLASLYSCEDKHWDPEDVYESKNYLWDKGFVCKVGKSC